MWDFWKYGNVRHTGWVSIAAGACNNHWLVYKTTIFKQLFFTTQTVYIGCQCHVITHANTTTSLLQYVINYNNIIMMVTINISVLFTIADGVQQMFYANDRQQHNKRTHTRRLRTSLLGCCKTLRYSDKYASGMERTFLVINRCHFYLPNYCKNLRSWFVHYCEISGIWMLY